MAVRSVLLDASGRIRARWNVVVEHIPTSHYASETVENPCGYGAYSAGGSMGRNTWRNSVGFVTNRVGFGALDSPT